ncbi:hypothetical protein GALL_167640 [mine drainage metagenome]|uniref:Uncharacterized protein n=1 Tax=mine drainage metagenome TaxID=410659 RepID=A0A1J5RZJ4_9ZZZZ
MASLKGNIAFTGSLGNLSAYTRKGSNNIILRTKGGASGKAIKTSPKFINTRRVMSEFGGASSTAKNIKLAMTGVTHLDHRFFQNKLNAICSRIQKLDTTSDWGQRSVLISRYKNLLEGFNLEMGTLFDSILKHPLHCHINRADQSASITVPALFPGISLYVPGKFSFFRLVPVLGIIPDMQWDAKFKKYMPVNPAVQSYRDLKITEWFGVSAVCDEQIIDMQIDRKTNISDSDSFILSIGIEFGNPLTASLIQPVKNAGAAKVVMLA